MSIRLKFYDNPIRITGKLHEDVSAFMTICRRILLGLRNVSSKVTEKIKAHILCSVTFFRKSCHLLDNEGKCCGAKEAADNMTHACCVMDK
jgi:hypothetical protein